MTTFSAVPSQYQGYVKSAAASLGIPVDVVATQINLESGWNPKAVSPAGAEGIAQFEPGTFASYGPKGGSPFNVADAFEAYVSYMSELLREEHGDLRKALEAYNAGPGNLGAGAGYASTILSGAGTGDVTASGGTGGGGGGGGAQQAGFVGDLLGSIPIIGPFLSAGSALSDVAKAIVGTLGPISQVFADLGKAVETTMTIVLWLVNPMNWLRLIAGVVGGVSLVAGLVLVAGAA